MGNDRQLQYLVKVVDQASANLQKIASEMEKLDRAQVKNTSSAGVASMGFLKMAGALGIAVTAVDLLSRGMEFLNQSYDRSIAAAKEYTSAFIGLSSVAAAFGEDQDKARIAAQELAKDGLMSVSEAAAGLKNLLGSKFNLDESIELMKAFKDAAAFNRQGTLEYGQAIVGATQGIKNQNSIMVDNVGITKNLSIILQEYGYSVMDLQRVTTDANVRQALYNGLIREGSIFAGDAARAAETLAGSEQTLATAKKELYNTIGQALAPALTLLNMNMTDATNIANAGLRPAIEGIAITLVRAAQIASIAGAAIKTALMAAGQAAINLSQGMMALNKGDWGGASNSFLKLVGDFGTTIDDGAKEIKKINDNTSKILKQIETQGVGTFGNVSRQAMGDIAGAVDSGGKKIADKLKQIQEKIEDINRSIAEQTRSFTDNVGRATADFDRQIRDLVVRHREAMASLRRDIAELNQEYSEAFKERLDDHNEKIQGIKDKYEDETKVLRDNLRRRVLDSKVTDQQLVKFFEAQIKEKDAKRDKEISDEQKAYEKQAAKEKAQHDKRLGELQVQLDKELEIERKHADVFAKFKDQVIEDDITRAQQGFEREMQQMRHQHDLRMQELERQLKEQEALKNQYMGTGVTSGTVYKSSGAGAPSKQTQSKTYSTNNNQTLNFTINNNNQKAPMNQQIKNALPMLGWMMK